MKQRITFLIDDATIVGDLFRPAGVGPHPAVVVVGPMTSVKEQVAGVYCAALAVRGIAALAIDHRHYGESGGSPRQYEHPEHKIADVRAAVRWLVASPAVDAARVGLVGVCLGSSYAAAASIGDSRVGALATVAGYFPDPHTMGLGKGGDFDAEIDSGVQARRHFERTGEVLLVAAAATGGGAPMHLPDIVEYYGSPRAGVANYRNEFAVMSREPWLSFDAQALAPQLTAPTLFVHAEGALAPQWATRFHDSMHAARRFEWLRASSQVDFYDRPDRVDQAADLVAHHLGYHLGGRPVGATG